MRNKPFVAPAADAKDELAASLPPRLAGGPASIASMALITTRK